MRDEVTAHAFDDDIDVFVSDDFLNAGESLFEDILLRRKVKNTGNFQIGAGFADDFINTLTDCAIS
jgi:hypothetical protein